MKETNCPKCQKAMRKGVAQVKGTFWGFLWFGFSWMKLFFYPDDDPQNSFPILSPVDRKKSFYCPHCRGVFIT
jgi:hypothetical protein